MPLRIRAAGLPGGRTEISGNISSQFLSALLMVAPCASQTVEITVTTELASKPYVDMTLAMMADFGVAVEREGYRHFLIRPARYHACRRVPIEPDATAASYFFAAPALCGGNLLVEGLNRRSNQGDLAFLDMLARMGCTFAQETDGIRVHAAQALSGVDVDMRDIPDTAQTLAVLAPFAQNPTRIRGIASARLKETDRIAATCRELRRLGVQVEEFEDGLCIQPCVDIHPAVVETYNDHRMAMAFSLIGLRVPGVFHRESRLRLQDFPGFLPSTGGIAVMHLGLTGFPLIHSPLTAHPSGCAGALRVVRQLHALPGGAAGHAGFAGIARAPARG